MRAKGIVEGFWRLYTDDFYDIRVPVPPPKERLEIIEHVERTTEKLNQAVHAAERECELLKEYQTRLIADVVTGKLDVRETVARLPDEEPDAGIDEPLNAEEAVEDMELDAEPAEVEA